MRLDDPNDEMAAAVLEAAKAGPRTADRTRAYLDAVLDAEQAQREWAADELAAIQWAGAGARFKRHWKPEPKPVPVGKVRIDVQTVVGVERDGEWEQVPMAAITLDELDHIIDQRTAARDRATGELVVLRRLRRFVSVYLRTGGTTTVAEALEEGGADLLDVMAGAA